MSLFYSRILWFMSPVFLFSALKTMASHSGAVLELTLFSLNSVSLSFPLIVDGMSLLFMSIVLFISANVLHLSNLYMEDEVYLRRFTHLVLLFIGSMSALIFIPHITALLLGWDGLGLVSFLLVTFYASSKALGAGMFTALSNRVGDALILISISMMYEWSYHFELISFSGQPVSVFCLMVAAMTKSAQFPFSSWLPAAMEAPTPVSALVHSSTLVTAGVYLMIRLYSFLSASPFFNYSILMVGAVTSLFAGLSAMVEFDLKKVIALSTLSQLGLMMMSIGLGFPNLAFFHLLTHAMFKALLFICAGCIIHFHGHAQDIRHMGGVGWQFPLITSCISISSFALCAVPFMSGFYSKDAILEVFFWSPFSLVVVCVALFSTLFTGMYSTRLLVSGILSDQKSVSASRFSEPIIRPVISLSIGAIVSGSVLICSVGPIAFEPFSPFSKSFLSSFLILAPLFVVILSSFDRFNMLNKARGKYYGAGSGMFFLTPVTSQNVLFSGNQSSRSVGMLDQSWFEGGQTFMWPIKSIGFMNLIITSGVFFVSLFIIVF